MCRRKIQRFQIKGKTTCTATERLVMWSCDELSRRVRVTSAAAGRPTVYRGTASRRLASNKISRW